MRSHREAAPRARGRGLSGRPLKDQPERPPNPPFSARFEPFFTSYRHLQLRRGSAISLRRAENLTPTQTQCLIKG